VRTRGGTGNESDGQGTPAGDGDACDLRKEAWFGGDSIVGEPECRALQWRLHRKLQNVLQRTLQRRLQSDVQGHVQDHVQGKL
jgi:hypothetical protein